MFSDAQVELHTGLIASNTINKTWQVANIIRNNFYAMCLCVCVCVYVCVYVYVHVCVHIYICVYQALLCNNYEALTYGSNL